MESRFGAIAFDQCFLGFVETVDERWIGFNQFGLLQKSKVFFLNEMKQKIAKIQMILTTSCQTLPISLCSFQCDTSAVNWLQM
jgi:hypothetical protein